MLQADTSTPAKRASATGVLKKKKATNKSRGAFCSANTGKYLQVEEQLVQYIRNLQQDGCTVSLSHITEQGSQKCLSAGHRSKRLRSELKLDNALHATPWAHNEKADNNAPAFAISL
ncbi:hypothetical protein HPB50_008495 [Hyalomma asiaticum]|uniref:Uncharacterized protein n=1 Tax=Hyalomma asiaticum TaxID=266040 RepID=A0ACB7SDK4_HYAAI|nr:hypothetical protein HPB50_008495 [Hyalomma asiaticum]